MNQKLILLLFLISLGTLQRACGQTAKFKALFLYNFTQNIGWPSNSGSSDKFIITVVGDKEMMTELEKLAAIKKVGSRSIIVKHCNQVKEVSDSQMVYLSATKSNLMPLLAAEHQNKPVLLVSSKEGLCPKGAAICFTTVDGKLRYEISPSNIGNHNLEVNNKLISLGIAVN